MKDRKIFYNKKMARNDLSKKEKNKTKINRNSYSKMMQVLKEKKRKIEQVKMAEENSFCKDMSSNKSR